MAAFDKRHVLVDVSQREIEHDREVVVGHHFGYHFLHRLMVAVGFIESETSDNQAFRACERTVQTECVKHALHLVDGLCDVFNEKNIVAGQQVERSGDKSRQYGHVATDEPSLGLSAPVVGMGGQTVLRHVASEDVHQSCVALVFRMVGQMLAHGGVDACHARRNGSGMKG